MRILVALCAVWLLSSSVSYAQDPKVQRGQKVYADSKCAVCHSVDGKGNAKGPLDAAGTKLTAEEIRQWMINPQEMAGKTKSTRKPPMPTFAKLPKEDLDAVIAYLMTLKKK
jgi:mono/diheme cytochrome c family protein